MPDNEGFESQTDTEGSTDSEDIAEQKSVVQPYQFAIRKKMAPCRFEKQSFANFGLLRQQLKRFLTSHVISSILTLPLHEFWSQQSAIIC